MLSPLSICHDVKKMVTHPQSELYQAVPLDRPLLRIGIMLDGTNAPAWVETLLKGIRSSGFAKLSLVILNANDPVPQPSQSRLKRFLTGQMKHALYSRYISFDEAKHGHLVTAMHSKDISGLIAGIPQMPIKNTRQKFVDRFSDADVESVKAHELDVILRFGFNIIKGEILQSARYGVWSYHHGDNNEYRGGARSFLGNARAQPPIRDNLAAAERKSGRRGSYLSVFQFYRRYHLVKWK